MNRATGIGGRDRYNLTNVRVAGAGIPQTGGGTAATVLRFLAEIDEKGEAMSVSEQDSGIVSGHISALEATAASENTFIFVRPTEFDSTILIRAGYATKSMDVHWLLGRQPLHA